MKCTHRPFPYVTCMGFNHKSFTYWPKVFCPALRPECRDKTQPNKAQAGQRRPSSLVDSLRSLQPAYIRRFNRGYRLSAESVLRTIDKGASHYHVPPPPRTSASHRHGMICIFDPGSEPSLTLILCCCQPTCPGTHMSLAFRASSSSTVTFVLFSV